MRKLLEVPVKITALIDSGAEGKFLSQMAAKEAYRWIGAP